MGLAIKAAEHFPERFVWSEGLMEERKDAEDSNLWPCL